MTQLKKISLNEWNLALHFIPNYMIDWMNKKHYLFFKKINGLSPRLLELESLYKIIYLKIK